MTMTTTWRWMAAVTILTGLTCGAAAQSPYAPWPNGPSKSDDFFPIAVWLQAPANAARYRAIGINTYVGIWRGPTPEQLAELDKNGIGLICGYKPGLEKEKGIIGWMHGDEPDNAQPLPKGQKGYGPPITPDKIVANYQRIKSADPTRPVMLNLGQGVAYDNYIGRGVRRGKLEDYPKYIQGCDIVSFDIYPVVHETPQIAGNLTYVAKGVTRLREWSKDQKLVWNCIETTHISNVNKKATPAQVRSEVWMSIIHGSRGIIYFAHEFKPRFIEAGLLADPEMARGVGAINAEIKSLAAVLNSPVETTAVTVTSAKSDVLVDLTARRLRGNLYIFAAAMGKDATRATFSVTGEKDAMVEVIGEGRSIPLTAGKFEDPFDGYAVHLYKIAAK